MNATEIVYRDQVEWVDFQEHIRLQHRCLLTPEKADSLGVRVSSILREKIDVGGIVLPHFHDVAEIIHITRGKVKVLYNGVWTNCHADDTLLVPAGVVHSVANDDDEFTEQISIFLPVYDDSIVNKLFETYLVPIEIPRS